MSAMKNLITEEYAEELANQFAASVAEAMDVDTEGEPCSEEEWNKARREFHHMESAKMWFYAPNELPEPGMQILRWLMLVDDFVTEVYLGDGKIKTALGKDDLHGYWMPVPQRPIQLGK